MFHNYLAAALRNLLRNRLYTAINVVGLAVGFAAALLIMLFVRDELSYDTWIPNHERTYLLTQADRTPGRAAVFNEAAYATIAPALKLDFPAIEAVARLVPASVALRHGDIETVEQVFWADPEFFSVLALKSIAGDLNAALARPDGIVLTRRMARKYFGRDMPLGQTLEINRRRPMAVGAREITDNPPLQVAAVIEDLPSNTNLTAEIFISGRATVGGIAWVDGQSFTPNEAPNLVQTYVRLKPIASEHDLEQGLPAFVERHLPADILGARRDVELGLLPIAQSHMNKAFSPAKKPTVDMPTLYMLSAIGLLIVAVAGINFINLMTARATRRTVEVGVRKVSGAERRNLIVQFLGESMIYVVLSMIVGMGLAVWALPSLNGYLERTMVLDVWRDGRLMAAILALALTVGIAAGAYPAFVLSAFRPATTLRASFTKPGGSSRLRQVLVLLQFAALVGFTLLTIVVWRQSQYAATQALRMDTDQVLIVAGYGACNDDVLGDFRALPGVRAAACSAELVSEYNYRTADTLLRDGSTASFATGAVGPGLFELYGFKPIAGRFFTAGRDTLAGETASASIVINESAVRGLGFSSAAAAVGQKISWGRKLTNHQTAVPTMSEIVGVVRDFEIDSINHEPQPTFFLADPQRFRTINLKLSGGDIPETLAAIDRLWDRNPKASRPLSHRFLDQVVETYYRDLGRQARMLAVCAAIALFIASLGLFGLAAFTAESRTKEIGIRKAMGASHRDILGLLLWQFTKPVLWANVIAWPVGYVVTQRWLEGFASHIDLELWAFLAASGVALAIAGVTVIGHALLVSRARPVSALRYE
jgi:putative ABC transport system permease protein